MRLQHVAFFLIILSAASCNTRRDRPSRDAGIFLIVPILSPLGGGDGPEAKTTDESGRFDDESL